MRHLLSGVIALVGVEIKPEMNTSTYSRNTLSFTFWHIFQQSDEQFMFGVYFNDASRFLNELETYILNFMKHDKPTDYWCYPFDNTVHILILNTIFLLYTLLQYIWYILCIWKHQYNKTSPPEIK